MGRWPVWLAVLFCAVRAEGAPDRVEEARLTAHLGGAPRPDRVVTIALDGGAFQALFDPARTRATRGAVVFLPEAGQPADAPIAGALRAYLPVHGWEVLSLQLPVLGAGMMAEAYHRLLPEGAARLRAAVAWLRSRQGGPVVGVGHGWGGLVLLKYLASSRPELQAAVLISPAWPAPVDGQARAWLAAVPVPVLDVYAEHDHPEIRRRAPERHLLLKDKAGYRQLRFSATGHHYRTRGGLLARRIDGWLRRAIVEGEGDE